jgi:Uma2 family endonuclease
MIALSTDASEKIRKLRREEYDRLVELGVFSDERIELLEGALIEMSPQCPKHSGTVRRLTALLVPLFESTGRAQVRVQLPFAATDDSEPEPDVAVVPNGDDMHEHPARAHLLIEVSESTLAKDRRKASLYAKAGVREYWIVNLDANLIEVHSDIAAGAYTRVTPYRFGETVTLIDFNDVTIPVNKILQET